MPTDEILREMLVSLLIEKHGWLLREAREYTKDMTEFSPAYREKIMEWSLDNSSNVS